MVLSLPITVASLDQHQHLPVHLPTRQVRNPLNEAWLTHLTPRRETGHHRCANNLYLAIMCGDEQ
jgi:hypothetical protein